MEVDIYKSIEGRARSRIHVIAHTEREREHKNKESGWK